MQTEAATRCTPPETACGHCGQAFVPRRRSQRFCRSLCRIRDWDARNPRIKVGTELRRVHVGVKLEGKPTLEQLEAAGIKVGRK